MLYPSNFEQRIGFSQIRSQCEAKCSTLAGRELLEKETFSTSEKDILRRISLADEMMKILSSEASAPSDDLFDVNDIVEKLRVEGGFLLVDEVVRLGATLRLVADMVDFVTSRPVGAYPYLTELTRSQQALPVLIREIDRIIDSHGEVLDSASEELSQIRREKRQHEGQVQKRLQAVLQSAKNQGIVEEDATISIRDGKPVIPVSAQNKRKLQGFIQDESATGRTFYVEPVEVVELNNKLKELEYAERREIIRILTVFTDLARQDFPVIEASGEYIVIIDMLRAKARWAIENEAVKPVLLRRSEEKGIRLNLRIARHPILAQTLRAQNRELIPLSAELSPKDRILVISGPNAGGKSVCLKTFGILQYMFQCGFPVTCSPNSELPVFSSMCIDIGDQQSIENDLSTYSSHLLNMKQMLQTVDENVFILIDEFGSGTEPIMGAAIAESMLEKFNESGCYGVITTHYSNIKYFAASHEGVQNGAMMFDVQNIRPLFKLEIGKPGSSFAVEIARKIGLPEQIIQASREKVGSEHMDLEKQLREIARDKHYWEQKRERIRQTDRKVESLEQEYSEQLDKIREERKKIIHEAKETARTIISEANKRIESTIKDIKESQADREITRLARQELESFRQEVESNNQATDERLEREMERLRRRQQRREERKNNPNSREKSAIQITPVKKEKIPVEVSSKVRILGQDGVGVVNSIRGNKAQVTVGSLLTTISLDRLEVISSSEFREKTKTEKPVTVLSQTISQRKLEFTPSIDVRGMRVGEAVEAVRNFTDDALMVGVHNVTILHGKGTGALKEELRKFLKAMPEVKSVKDDHPDRGGSGISLVEFYV